MAKQTEYCGRCAMSTVVDAVDAVGDEDEDVDENAESRDPFAGERIELSDRELRRVSPAAWVSGLARRLDAFAERVVHRR